MARVETVELLVEGHGIHCRSCENRIQAVLGKLPGVAKAKADHRSQRIVLLLDQDKTLLGEVIAKLDFLGYTVTQGRGVS